MREVGVGERLDQYQITELIARSGMASILKAIDTENGQTVALKVPYPQFESDVVFYERFRREEAIGQRLNHPNIIKVFTPRRKSRMYIAMEYVEGASLRALLRDKRPFSAERALGYASQICRALIYLHQEGVVHRDLKPENLLATDADQIKIMDFGIALDESARRLTWAGLSTTVGTPDYMAPEQISGRRGDARTDIYALGMILYEMLTANLPFEGPNVYAVMKAKAAKDPQPPSRWVPDLDPKLEEIVLHAIERSPRSRYASAAEMLADLENPSQVQVTGRVRHLHPPTSWQRFRSVVMTTVFFVSLIGIFVLLIWLARRYPAAPARTQGAYRGATR